MKFLVEILLGLLLIFLLIGQPFKLRKLTYTMSGKVVFLAAAIGASFYSIQAGVLIAIIYMTLRKDFMLVESMSNASDSDSDSTTTGDNNTDFVKKYCKDGKVDNSLNPPALTFKNEECNPCDDNCEFDITDAQERMTVDEALRPKESNSIPV